MPQQNDLIFNKFSNKMMLNIDMLGSAMLNKNFRNIYDSNIITI